MFNAIPPLPNPFKIWRDEQGKVHVALCGICPCCGREKTSEIPLAAGCKSPIQLWVDCQNQLHTLVQARCPCGGDCSFDAIIPVMGHYLGRHV